jgi:hypothetical protein
VGLVERVCSHGQRWPLTAGHSVEVLGGRRQGRDWEWALQGRPPFQTRKTIGVRVKEG